MRIPLLHHPYVNDLTYLGFLPDRAKGCDTQSLLSLRLQWAIPLNKDTPLLRNCPTDPLRLNQSISHPIDVIVCNHPHRLINPLHIPRDNHVKKGMTHLGQIRCSSVHSVCTNNFFTDSIIKDCSVNIAVVILVNTFDPCIVIHNSCHYM